MNAETISRLIRERARLAPSSRPEDGTAYDLAIDLIEAGYGLSERDGKLMVRPPRGVTEIPKELRERIPGHKDLILAMLRPRPEMPFSPGWEQEWRHELDGMLRTAAAMLPSALRDDVLTLSRRTITSEAEWQSLLWELMELCRQIARAGEPAAVFTPPALVPWRGWVREDGGEWRDVATSDDWDECWRLTRAAPVATDHSEKCILPASVIHPEKGRKKQR